MYFSLLLSLNPQLGGEQFSSGMRERSTMEPSDVVEVREIQKTFLQMNNSLMSFALFAPRDVVVDMLSSGKEARLSVNEQNVTVFFSHIDNFEELNERTNSKKDLLIMLSKYFDVVTDAIAETEGTLLDFIGDMVLAIGTHLTQWRIIKRKPWRHVL